MVTALRNRPLLKPLKTAMANPMKTGRSNVFIPTIPCVAVAAGQRDQVSEWGGFSAIFSIGARSRIAPKSQGAVTTFPRS
jgi:hypothetical protein